MKRKPRKPDRVKRLRAIARERVGTVKATRPIEPKSTRAKPKHKRPPGEED